MSEAPKQEKKHQLTVVCLRGHHAPVLTVNPLGTGECEEEVHEVRCVYCDALPMYMTDGVYMVGFDRTPEVREEVPERH